MNLGHLDFDIVSNFVLRISYFASLGIFTLVERALQIRPFMQNKPNLPKAQMNLSTVLTKNYEQITMNNELKNKPNTKPIKANTKPIIANKMPKQTQYKAKQSQFQRQKMLLSTFLLRDVG